VFRGIGSGIGMHWRTKLVLWVLGLAFIAMLVVFSEEPSFPKPPDTCTEKGIDPSEMKEGTCDDGGTRMDVVDIGDTLELRTLKARLDGIHEAGSLATFDLTIKSRAFKPVYLGKYQVVLVLGQDLDQDVEAETLSEPHSFLSRSHPIQPGETVRGTVVFEVTPAEIEEIEEEGNLDIANFRHRGDAYNTTLAFSGSEYGVMRTYTKPH
jgi:hypothetical protein